MDGNRYWRGLDGLNCERRSFTQESDYVIQHILVAVNKVEFFKFTSQKVNLRCSRMFRETTMMHVCPQLFLAAHGATEGTFAY